VKYRHRFHAGNFADVHKHVMLLALLAALKRKDKGFLYLDTHAGRGSYDVSGSAEAAAGIGRFAAAAEATSPAAEELRDYAARLAAYRARHEGRAVYPGSPLLALGSLRPQDRAVLIELEAAEARALERLAPHVTVERGDGFERLRAWLPPPERRALTFLDPPYEQRRSDSARLSAALVEGLRRFPTGVFAAWYPIKDERSVAAWKAGCARAVRAPLLASELWLYPRDARVALNGSGVLVANPPWRLLECMRVWLPELESCLARGAGGGNDACMLRESAS
jgi:23S rRNA (adenine2030-N6)-methyltransferase